MFSHGAQPGAYLRGPSKAVTVTYTSVSLRLSQNNLFAFQQHIWSKTNTVALSSFPSSLKASSRRCCCAPQSTSTSRKLHEVPAESHCRPTRIDSACLINDRVSFRPGLKDLIRLSFVFISGDCPARLISHAQMFL